VATTYLSRGDKGERADVLEVYDTRTLVQKYEVVLPPRRAQTLAYRGLVRTTANGRFVLVQNATPATSITVVDRQQRKVVAEIATPGCWGILPASGQRKSPGGLNLQGFFGFAARSWTPADVVVVERRRIENRAPGPVIT